MKSIIGKTTFALVLAAASANLMAEDLRLEGVFVNRTPNEKPIHEAIDKSVASFNFVARPIARSRLKKSNPMITRAEFLRQGSDIVLKLGIQKPVVARPGGTTVKWTRDDGEVLEVGFLWEEATLVQSFKAEDGMRYNRYTLSADNSSLHLDVTLTSPMLEKPVNYRLTLTREFKQ